MGRKEENFIFVGCEDGDLLEEKKKKKRNGRDCLWRIGSYCGTFTQHYPEVT
jgi:hypothetical protein